eukprot:TRINITY_DN20298_c0_g1_i1.p1 TRINITY_DN20298_c0_g1~~TRINITY_DN20298_c0_g1_i1.p1  ORF type:complete len:230 (-),score=74.71 TRINITY_DN20298_c0_g1_i1:618-1307(-)
MTTAARPTWAPAKGGEEQGGARMFAPSQKYSSRELPSHTKLKTRKEGQDSISEIRERDLKSELLEKERKHFSAREKERGDYGEERRKPSGLLEAPGGKRDAEDRFAPKAIDADDSDVEAEDSDASDEDDDEDDTAELLAELERIKKERAEERLKKERQQQEEEAKTKEAELIRGNPLLNQGGSFTVKRRWDDDVVFRNQARAEQKVAKRFINDTIRNDFHRKFLNKYMK